VFHCEIDENLQQIASHNFKVLNAKNVQTFAQNGLEFLKNSSHDFDWLYLDPSRRNKIKGKVFLLSDSEPNVIENSSLLFGKSKNILIKTSPLLDISMGIKELNGIREIHIFAINNEVKELLWVLNRGYSGEIDIKTVNITKSNTQTFNFELSKEKTTSSKYSLPLAYIYEPNAAILKSGAFKVIGYRLNLKKLHQNTHLYTSEKLLNFPGRRFETIKIAPYNNKAFKTFKLKKANITTRNFKDSVATIRKKFKIKEGGDSFLFFFKDKNDTFQMALCNKV